MFGLVVIEVMTPSGRLSNTNEMYLYNVHTYIWNTTFSKQTCYIKLAIYGRRIALTVNCMELMGWFHIFYYPQFYKFNVWIAWHLQKFWTSHPAPTDFEVPNTNWHPQSSFYVTSGTLSFKFLTQALILQLEGAYRTVLLAHPALGSFLRPWPGR